MKKIKCPTKLIWAKNDELFAVKYATQFQHKIKNSKIIIVDGTHDWPILKPSEIMKYLQGRFN